MSLAQEFSGLSETAHQTIVDIHGESQQDRVVGYLATQSLRKVMEFLEPEQIIKAKGKRRIYDRKNEVSNVTFPGAEEFVNDYEKHRQVVQLDFERDRRGVFPWKAIYDGLEDNDDLEDIPLRTLAIQFEDDQLHQHLWEHIQETLKNQGVDPLHDSNAFKQPFIAELSTTAVPNDAVERSVRGNHDVRYWMNGDETDEDGHRGLGWSPRTLDLEAIWSRVAWGDSKRVVTRSGTSKYSMRDIEEAVFNRVHDDKPIYGVVNSKLAVNKWRSVFSRGVSDMKRYEWRKTEGWALAGGGS